MSTSGTGSRSGAVDAVRVLAIVAVVVGHVWTGGAAQSVLYTWHVPVFFLLTGYLWRPGRPLTDEVARRSRTLLVPYLTWLVLVSVVVLAVDLVRGVSPLGTFRDALLGGAYVGRPYSAFWFVTALFAAALVARLTDALPALARRLLAVALVLLAAATAGWQARVPLALGVGVFATAFVLAGRELRPLLDRVAAGGRDRQVALGVGLLAVGATAVALGSAPLDLKQGDWGTPLLSAVVAVLLSVGLVVLANALVGQGRFAAAATFLAEGGLLVVLSHAVVLWLAETPPDGRWPDLLAALVLPWGLALAVRRTRLAPFLLGRG